MAEKEKKVPIVSRVRKEKVETDSNLKETLNDEPESKNKEIPKFQKKDKDKEIPKETEDKNKDILKENEDAVDEIKKIPKGKTTSEYFEERANSKIRSMEDEFEDESLEVIERTYNSNQVFYSSIKEANIDFADLKSSESQKQVLENNKIIASLREKDYKYPKVINLMQIVGIEHCNYKGKRQRMVVGYVGDYKVVIPEEEFFEERELGKDINRRLGSICNFTVLSVQELEDMSLVVATRKKAILALRQKHWQLAFLRNKYITNTKKPLPLIHEGAVIPANVVEIIKNSGVVVELGGVETLIPRNEISYLAVTPSNIDEFVEVGTSTFIKILEVNNRNDVENISFKASIKRVHQDKQSKKNNKVVLNGIYMGVITSFYGEQNRYFITLKQGVEVLADPPSNSQGLIMNGKEVSVQIVKTFPDPETGEERFKGKIKFIYKK